MGDKPTLGQQITAAASSWSIDVSECGAHSPEARGTWSDLLTLSDRADAAERLAHAADALGWTVEADYMAGSVEFKTALRAWREVGGE